MSAFTGALSLPRCAELLAQAEGLLAHGSGPCTIDLAQTTAADSAGLSLLLEIRRRAARAGRTLSYAGAPAQLRGLAQFFGVSPFLALSA